VVAEPVSQQPAKRPHRFCFSLFAWIGGLG